MHPLAFGLGGAGAAMGFGLMMNKKKRKKHLHSLQRHSCLLHVHIHALLCSHNGIYLFQCGSQEHTVGLGEEDNAYGKPPQGV